MPEETEYHFLKIKKNQFYDVRSKGFKRIFTNNYKTDIVRRKSLEL